MKDAAEGRWTSWLLAVSLRASLLALLWWAFTEGDTGGWWAGGGVIAAGVVLSFKLLPAGRRGGWHPIALASYLRFFAAQSVLGGVDVALRAFHPHLPVNPGFVGYPVRLPEEAVPLLTATISLFPGTVGVSIEGGTVRLHLIDVAVSPERKIRLLEEYIADLLGIQLTSLPPEPPSSPDAGSSGLA